MDANRIEAALEQIAEAHPQRPGFVTELTGHPTEWRARKGNNRAIYRLIDDTLVVISVGHSKEIYERVPSYFPSR